MSLKGNKGEWSEVYTLLKLIADGVMQKGDSDLQPIKGESYKIISLERKEGRIGKTSYLLKNGDVVIKNSHGSIKKKRCEFSEESKSLLDVITKGKKVFGIPATEKFLKEILTYSIKAASGEKADLKVEIHDHRTSLAHTRGFSIKSQLGSASTLLNASQQTRFQYRLKDINSSEAEKINSISTKGAVIDRIKAIEELANVVAIPSGAVSDSLNHNLTLVDDALPDILSSLLWNFYSKNESQISKLLPYITLENIRGYNFANNETMYASKIKRLLVSVALGMTPAKIWDGIYNANGGYLIVLKSGEIISYHIYDKADFEDYLFHNTKIETPSTTRHKIGTIEKDSDGFYIDLALQIRFCV